VLVHLSIFMFGLIGPLVVYLVTKDDPYKQMTRHHAAEALNFHITLTLAAIASVVLILVIVGIFLLIASVHRRRRAGDHRRGRRRSARALPLPAHHPLRALGRS
jgi:heme/copper-type cytochrome/quinol oxidase subunit 2